jgi:hypothetical protein
MFFAVDLHVCLGQSVDRLSILARIEGQVSIAILLKNPSF